MSDVTFDVASLRRAGGGMQDAAEDLAARAQSVLRDCGDLSALGTYDTLGSVAQAMYAAVLERVQDTVDSLVDTTDNHGVALRTAADLYEETERDNAAAGHAVGKQAVGKQAVGKQTVA